MRMGRHLAIFISHSYDDADLYHELISQLRARKRFKFRDTSVPDISQIETANPKRAIRARIKRSDVMLVFTGRVATNSEFIQFELDTARRLGKPIIAVKPIGEQHISRVVRNAALIVIDWDIEEIVRQIRDPGMRPICDTAPTATDDGPGTAPSQIGYEAPPSGNTVRDVLRRMFRAPWRPPSPAPPPIGVARRKPR